MNNYERSKMLRVQENKERLRELGVKSIAKSLTNLVESPKTKKRKERPTVINEQDVEYTPDLGGDSEEEDQEDIARSVRLPQKQNRLQYIAPMSISRC